MTIPSTTRKAGPLLGTGAQTTWPFTFKVFAESDITVTIADALGVDTTLVLDSDYSVALNNNQDTSPGGTITYPLTGTPLAVGSVLSVVGSLPYDQPLDLPAGGNFSPLAIENELDRLTMQIQQLREEITRTLRVSVTTDADALLPAPAANQLIAWDASGQSLQNVSMADLGVAVAYGTFRYDTFVGDGTTTQFTPTSNPATIANLDVAVDGLTWVPGTDYTLVSGVVVFATAPVDGAEILVRYGEAMAAAPGDAADISYHPAGTGAVATDVQTKLRERKSLLDFMTPALKAVVVSGVYTAQNRTDMLTALNAAWASALAAPHDLYAPAGRYELGEASFPWRNTQYPVTSLLDCENVTLYCDGPAAVFATVSAGGADVFQLNGLQNFHVKGFPTLTASLTATLGAGSNGCSVTNGFDNLTLEISPTNCQGIDKTTYIDGGKGLTIQTPTVGQTIPCGRLKATVNAKGCVHGFGLEQDIVTAVYMRGAIDIDLMAEDCFIGVTYSAAAASTGGVPQGATVGLRVRGQAINCQKAVVLGRAHGVDVDIQTITSKTAAARRLDFNGVAWTTSDTVVEGLVCAYAHNSRIAVHGYLGSCDYKARIGGAAAGTSGLYGGTYNCDIYLDLGGSPGTANIANIDSGGNNIAESRLHITSYTAVTAPTEWYASANNNTIVCGAAASVNFGNVKFPAAQFASTDPNTLDDYQEGTFTPIFTDWSLIDKGVTYSVRRGEYTKVGNVVYFICTVALTSIGTAGAGNPAFILGLPFTSRNVSGNVAGLSVGVCSGLNVTAGDVVSAFVATNEANITLHKWPAAGTTGTAALTVGEVSADGALTVSGHYFV